ncbi:nucleotidyltransferase domain-containing protein [candidate division KSB1 bacterium]|nr:nucleotidyltransferase domain-containing protein [candidate division KSB1 bacterium]
MRVANACGVYYLYGSTAEGIASPDSDIDIAIDNISPDEYFRILNFLAESSDTYFIDLRDISGSTGFFAQRIRRSGIKIYESIG